MKNGPHFDAAHAFFRRSIWLEYARVQGYSRECPPTQDYMKKKNFYEISLFLVQIKNTSVLFQLVLMNL